MAEIQVPTPNSNKGPAESSLIRPSSIDKASLSGKTREKPKLKGGINKKQPSFGEKLKRSFVKDDIKDVRDYVIFDILIPGIQQGLFNAIVGTASQIFHVPTPRMPYYGGYSGYGNLGQPRLTPHERKFRDYNSIQPRAGLQPSASSMSQEPVYNRFYAQDYPFTYKEDADSVLEQMIDICDADGWVSVAQFFDMADPEGSIAGRNPYTNNNYGWHEITTATVKFAGDGYVITLPPARPR